MNYRVFCSFLLFVFFSTDAQAASEKIALCIGVNKSESNEFENANYAENGITEFASLLRDVGYKVVLITHATGKLDPKLAPTKANIETQIIALIEKRQPDDTVILALAGHEFEFDKDPDSYFCPVDAELRGEKKNTLISIERIYTQLGKCRAKNKVLLAECYRSESNQLRNCDQGNILLKMPPKGVLALYACAYAERAFEFAELRQGVFFHHINEGMRSKAGKADCDLQFEDLVGYISKEVPRTVQRFGGTGKQQTPILKTSTLTNNQILLLTAAERQVLVDIQTENDLRMTGGILEFYKTNGAKRLPAWKIAAECGSARGMVLYGKCLILGAGTEKDPNKAVEWFRKAAVLWNPEAMFNLGQCYRLGIGVEKNLAKSFEWHYKAAELGEPHSMHILGLSYLQGTGVVADLAKGVEWLSHAAELGERLSMNWLGICYFNGYGVKKDVTKAVEWYRKATELGEAWSMNNLAMCYRNGTGVEVNSSKAFELFQKSAEIGNTSAMTEVGNCYREGKGVQTDLVKAFEWYGKAAELGDAVAMNNLGACYLRGNGVLKDLSKASEYLLKAAELGNVPAMSTLGWCYATGSGVEKDFVKANEWLRKAAESEDPNAKSPLQRLREK